MTVSSLTAKSGPYTANGTQTVFAYGFKVFAAGDLQVVRTVAGAEAVLALNVDYTVSGVGSDLGGNVTMVTAPAAGALITIVRSVPLTQEVDLRNQSGFYPEVHERAFDRSTMQVQQLNELIGRGLRVPVSDAAAPVLPGAAARASKVLVFDVNGHPGVADVAALASVPASAFVQVQEFVGNGTQTVFTLGSAPGNSAMVEVSIGGIVQSPTVDYSVAGNQLTISPAPPNGQRIIARWIVAESAIASLQQLVLAPRTPAPASPTQGWIYYESTTNKVRVWTGAAGENLN